MWQMPTCLCMFVPTTTDNSPGSRASTHSGNPVYPSYLQNPNGIFLLERLLIYPIFRLLFGTVCWKVLRQQIPCCAAKKKSVSCSNPNKNSHLKIERGNSLNNTLLFTLRNMKTAWIIGLSGECASPFLP